MRNIKIIGVLFLVIDMFTAADNYASIGGMGAIMVYVFAVIFAITIFSGVIMLIGVKSRGASIIGGIFPLVIGVFILLYTFGINLLSVVDYLMQASGAMALVPGIIPLEFGFAGIYIGTLLLLVGGILGIAGGAKSRSFY